MSLLLVGALMGCGQRADPQRLVEQIVSSEDLILALTPNLRELSEDILNLELPHDTRETLFDRRVSIVDLGSDPATPKASFASVGARSLEWSVSSETTIGDSHSLAMWRALLSGLDYFEHANFYFISGDFQPSGDFETIIGFDGLARDPDGVWRGVSATQRVVWRELSTSAGDSDSWRIVAWHLEDLETTDSRERWFSERLDWALSNPATRRRARESLHERHLVETYEKGAEAFPEKYRGLVELDSVAQHPALSVVDFDDDGLDDLYVMQRWGSNLLLRNLGDGTFEEVAASVGLDVQGLSTGGIFADFDNDGDSDIILGRSLERSLYLVNEGGHYVDRTESHISGEMPFFVTAVSAADYNNDGLVDVYLSTYVRLGTGALDLQGLRHYLSEGDLQELERRWSRLTPSDLFLDRIGPANLLLVNRGEGHFEVAPENSQVQLWRDTLQSTWGDFDGDGDQDLYVANDYAPDNFLRNDGSGGFVDITQEMGGDEMLGFGMGASWGDYDLDGAQDLYVSNMYSKAGSRIVAQVDGLDERFGRSAHGNLLFRNTGDAFQLVSGLEPPALNVARAGWSWGGQFVDIDNDSFLDLYVASGNFTAPRPIASDVDV